MNKTIKVAIVIILTMVGNTYTYSQSIDQERMDRDLKVAENILSTLSNDGNNRWSRDKVEGSYIPDYGVILTMPSNSLVIYGGASQIISSGANSVYVIDDSDDKDKDVDIKIKGGDQVKVRTLKGQSKKAEDLKEQMESGIKEQIETFLADYADLIGQLKPSDRIMVQVKNNRSFEFYLGGRSEKASGNLSGSVLKSDLTAQKQGKISRDQLIQRIKYTTPESTEVAKDIELFATIFARLYEPDLSSTYYASSRRIAYNRLENLGVTFNMKFYSSSSDAGKHTIRTTGETGLTQEERNERVNAMYPEFEQSFRENLLDYGRTVKSLQPGEMMIFKVKLTECKGCEMPGEIEVVVKAKTLIDYDQGSLSRDKALQMIEVKKKNS